MNTQEREKLVRYLGAAVRMMAERCGPGVKFVVYARAVPTDVEATRDPDIVGQMVLVGNESNLHLLHEVIGDLLRDGVEGLEGPDGG